MSTLPDPPIPPDVDLSKLDGFMLNTEKLLGSELVALSTGDEFKAAVLLWCRAWKQRPAASLPKDDRILASFAGVSLAKWKKIRAVAMRGWTEHSDGRLYHPVLTSDALRAHKAQRQRQEAIAKRWGKATADATGSATKQPSPKVRETYGRNTGPIPETKTGQGQGQGSKKIDNPPEPPLAIDDEMRAWAAEHTPSVRDLDGELAKYRDWKRSKGTQHKDARAGFRNWLRKAEEFAQSRGGGSAPRRADQSPDEERDWQIRVCREWLKHPERWNTAGRGFPPDDPSTLMRDDVLRELGISNPRLRPAA